MFRNTRVQTNINKVIKLRNSQVGNPQYKLETDLADFKTEANGGWVYGIPFNRLENKSVLLTINGRGTISKIEGEF